MAKKEKRKRRGGGGGVGGREIDLSPIDDGDLASDTWDA